MAAGLLALCTSGCSSDVGFVQCRDDGSCDRFPDGRCFVNEATGHKFCTYPDDDCDSGRRWSDLNVEEMISGQCFVAGIDAGIGVMPDAQADAEPDAEACPHDGEVGFVDEDGDLIDDRCDNCPADSNSSQTDSDRDGVGDACDLTASPTRIAFFDGFHDAAVGGWEQLGSAGWTVVDGQALGNAQGFSILAVDGLSVPSGRVVVPLTITSIPTAADHVIGVVGRLDVGSLDRYACVADERGTTGVMDGVINQMSGGSQTAIAGPTQLSDSFAVGTTIRFTAQFSSGHQGCVVSTSSAVSLEGADATFTSGTVGVFVQGAAVTAPYVIVYEEL